MTSLNPKNLARCFLVSRRDCSKTSPLGLMRRVSLIRRMRFSGPKSSTDMLSTVPKVVLFLRYSRIRRVSDLDRP